MKRIHNITTLSIISLLLVSCTVSNTPYAFDDLYYSPSKDPVQQARVETPANNQTYSNTNTYNDRYAEDGGTNYNASQYQNSYAKENQQQAAQSNKQAEDVEYYDEDYAQTLQTINAPVRSFNTYDPYQRDRIMYTQNPVFAAPSVYGGFQFWDPFMPTTGLSVGWNSFNGWNVGINAGVGFGCGRALNPYARFYDPFWGNNMGWNDPFWGPQFGWGNNRGWNNQWGWNNGFNNFSYQNGYRDGFNNGAFNNYRNYAVGNNGTNGRNGRRQVVAPRGNAGSRNVSTGSGARPVRPVRGGNSEGTNTSNPVRPSNARPTRPATGGTTAPGSESRPSQNTRPNTTRPTATRPNATRPVRSTPQRYEVTPNRPQQTRPTQSRPTTQPSRPATQPAQSTPNSRPTYTRPTQQTRPTNTRPATRPTTRPAQQQARPRTNTQPRQQSRPSYNNSKPTYSAPSRSSGGSRSSSPSRGTTTRPSRR